jgi:hypothetical protein
MARWLEIALGWPQGYLDPKLISSTKLKEHPLYKLLEKR